MTVSGCRYCGAGRATAAVSRGNGGGGAHVEEGMWREGGVTEEGDVGKVAERNGVTMEEA